MTLRTSAAARRTPSKMGTATALGLVEGLLKVSADVAAVGDEVKSCKRSCWNLARRVKLLAPLLEEIRDVKGPLPPAAIASFQSLRTAFLNARKILMDCCARSRLYMVLHRESMAARFKSLNLDLCRALEQLPLELMAVSEEIQEQVQMVLGQLRRANPLDDAEEEQLYQDLVFLLSSVPIAEDDVELSGSFQVGSGSSSPVSVAVWGPFMAKLGLTSLPAVKREMNALRAEKNRLLEEDRRRRFVKKQLSRARSGNDAEPIARVAVDGLKHASGCKFHSRGPLSKSLNSLTVLNTSLSRLEVVETRQQRSREAETGGLEQARGECEADESRTQGGAEASEDEETVSASVREVERAIALMQQLRASLGGGSLGACESGDEEEDSAQRKGRGSKGKGGEREGKPQEPCVVVTRSGQTLHPPEDFLCPISLEVMRDPVIVSTGQTYEKPYIEHWIKEGNTKCPRTQQLLSHPVVLIPNYSLRSLIEQWCESNGVNLPKRPQDLQLPKSGSTGSVDEQAAAEGLSSECSRTLDAAEVESLSHRLTERLSDPDVGERRQAAAELRLLAKRSDTNRAAVAKAGAIPPLVRALSESDEKVQEHAVTALLNLSIRDANKGSIVEAHGIPAIVRVLQGGTVEAQENAAAALFSLASVDENKVAIGQAGAVPSLVQLLKDGGQRGKKDAATALFTLCLNIGNKTRAVRAGVVPALVRLLVDPQSGMVDEALAILSVISVAPEGRDAMGTEFVIPVLVDITARGSPRNKENAAAVLLTLCSNSAEYTELALSSGVLQKMQVLLRTGTPRAKRKASALLQHYRDFELMRAPTGDTFALPQSLEQSIY